MGHEASNCWEHEANKDERPKNWKKKEEKEVEASNIEILLGCTKTSTVKYENGEVLFENDLWELALQKLDKIPVPSNPPDDNKNNMGNIIMEETKENGLDGEKRSSGTECFLNNIEKLQYWPKWLCCKAPIFELMTLEHLYIVQMMDMEVSIYAKVVAQVP